MKRTEINLVPDITNPAPDYYCTWQTQLYATCDGKPPAQRAIIGEEALFSHKKPYGWAYFYEKARRDLFFVMDDSWDVPKDGNSRYYGSLILNDEKFPESTRDVESNATALSRLSERITSLGWKGLGGWVCAQEADLPGGDISDEEYWIKRLKEAADSGFSYWKVDWGKKKNDFDSCVIRMKEALSTEFPTCLSQTFTEISKQRFTRCKERSVGTKYLRLSDFAAVLISTHNL